MRLFVKNWVLTVSLGSILLCTLVSCRNERQQVVNESVRLINNAADEMTDMKGMQLQQLKNIPQNLQDSLAFIQDRHPNVVLTESDNRQIKLAMDRFEKAQLNAITSMQRQLDQMQDNKHLTSNDNNQNENIEG